MVCKDGDCAVKIPLVVAVSSPFCGSDLLEWIHNRGLKSLDPIECAMLPGSDETEKLHRKVREHGSVGNYCCITGSLDAMVRPHSALMRGVDLGGAVKTKVVPTLPCCCHKLGGVETKVVVEYEPCDENL